MVNPNQWLSRLHVQIYTKSSKNVNIIEFDYGFWNHRGKCIQISTNMPSIGSVIRELDVTFLETKTILCIKKL